SYALSSLYCSVFLHRLPPRSPLFPYPTLFRSASFFKGLAGLYKGDACPPADLPVLLLSGKQDPVGDMGAGVERLAKYYRAAGVRSEEHTSELQSRFDLVCRLLLEKKNKQAREE